MKKKENIKSSTQIKKNVTMTMIIVFSIILAATAGITNFLVRGIVQIIAFIGQLVVIKALLDDFYREE